MDRVKIYLKNCYGIRSLSQEFDFTDTEAYALYAPNGVMKSSLAKTFQDAANESDSTDRIFPSRTTVRQIIDEEEREIEGSRVLVVLPYDEDLGIGEKTSTLLLDPKLKKHYDELLRATAQAKSVLLKAIKQQSKSRQDMEVEISSAIMATPSEFDAALIRVRREVEDLTDVLFADVEYDLIFNEKVSSALETKDLKNAIEQYAQRYDELLSNSTYFKKGTFDYYNAGQIARSLVKNGFFAANHSINLNARTGNREIKNKAELEALISREKEEILEDQVLRQRFEEVTVQLTRNVQLRTFYEYIRENEAILSRLHNPAKLKQDVIKSYLKVHEGLYNDWMEKHDAVRSRRVELEEEARRQQTQWEDVIRIFNERFFVPFRLEAKNKTEVMLGQTSIINLGFTYLEGGDKAELERDELLKCLSMGERKALYILNVIFEIETRKKANQDTLIIVDDLADSFDYRNKYAIIQYLKDISDEGLFKLIVMTHNFDFLRTIESRFVGYPNCYMASRHSTGVTLARAAGIRNVFANDWKTHFFDNPKKKIASIPFLRNLVEMTTGVNNPDYEDLTSMLHWKSESANITVRHLDTIFNRICHEKKSSINADKFVYELLTEQAEMCLGADTAPNLENKIVLAIGTRMMAERFMIDRLNDPGTVEEISANQAHILTEKFRSRFPNEHENIATLDRVALMTPENIHVNSFMYEPIIDMSDDHLRKLFSEVKALH